MTTLLKTIQRICRVSAIDAPFTIQEFIESDEYDVLRVFLEDVVNDIRWRKDFTGIKAVWVPTQDTLIEYRDEFENEVPATIPNPDDPDEMIHNPAITSSLHQLPSDFIRVTASGDALYNTERRIVGTAINNQTTWQLFTDVGTTYYEGYRLNASTKTIQISREVTFNQDGSPLENVQLSYVTDGWIIDPATGLVYDDINDLAIQDTFEPLLDAELLYYGTTYRFKEDNGYPFQRYKMEYDKKLKLKFESEQDDQPVYIHSAQPDGLAELDSFPAPEYLRLRRGTN